MDTKDKIKTALHEEIPHWDHESLWKDIQDNRSDKKDSRKKRYFYYYVAMGLIACIVIGFLFNNRTNEIFIKNNFTENINTTDVIHTDTPNNNANKTFNRDNNLSIISNKNLKNKNIQSIKEDKKSILTKITKTKYSTLSNKEIITQELLTNNKPTTKQYQEKESNHLQNNEENNLSNKGFINSDTSQLKKNEQQVNISIPQVALLYPITPHLKTTFHTTKHNLSIIPLKSNKNNEYCFTLNTGIYYSQRRLESDKYKKWSANLNLEEQILESSEIEIGIQKHIFNKISIGIGLGYIHSRILYHGQDTITIEKETIESDTAYQYQSGSNTHYITGETTQTTYTIRNYNSTNLYQNLNIPITIHYRIPLSKSYLAMGLGTDINIWSSYSGYTRHLNNKITNNQQNINGLFRNSINIVSWHGSINYTFPIKNFQFTFGIRYKSDFRSRSINPNIDLRHKQMGITTGIIWQL